MAFYHDDERPLDPGQHRSGTTFAPPPGAATPPPRARTSPAVLAAILIGGTLIVATVGIGFVTLRPEVQLHTPIEESLPYTRTAGYLAGYDEIANIVGAEPRIRTGERSSVDWSVAGGGSARVHLYIDGAGGKTQVFADWVRERDAWAVRSASYLRPDGEQIGIPLGAGTFLSRYDLAAWRAADPTTPLGRGQRELIEGRPFQAITLFNEVLGGDPEHLEALLWRGRSFEAVGNVPKALADYQRIVASDPTNAAALARLDGLRASPGVDDEVTRRPSPPDAPSARPSPTSLIPQ